MAGAIRICSHNIDGFGSCDIMADGVCVQGPCHAEELVEYAPVVHGRWDDIPNTYMSVASKDGTYHGNATSCSVCHEVNPNAYKTNYCPNCGAKMDGGEG